MRLKLTLLVIILALAGCAAWLFTLPTATSCGASGRIVDVSRRYCITDTGSKLLREHAMSHATDPIVGVPAVLVAGVALLVAARSDRRKR